MMIESLTYFGVKQSLNDVYLASLNAAMDRYEINTALRASHFMAQVLHESGMLQYAEELASGSAYEGRQDLGNIQAGDGEKFKGRGFIQLTGRKVYLTYGAFTAQDFVDHPQLVATPQYAADSAGWFWNVFKKDSAGNSLNMMADTDQFLRITYFVNGGFNGVADRLRLLDRSYTMFGVTDGRAKVESILHVALENITNESRGHMEQSLLKHFPDEASIQQAREGLDK